MADFESFFRAERVRTGRIVALAWGDPTAAEDAVQEAMARALVRWRRVGSMEHPERWVYVTAMNILRRSATRFPVPVEHELDGIEGDSADGLVTTLVVRGAVVALPRRQRQAVVLRFLGELSLADVALAMGCAVGTVKSTLPQALAALHVDLEAGSDS